MSNLTLKEQLEALSLGSPAPQPHERKLKPTNQKPKTQQSPKPRPAWLEHAQYGVELLRAHFPACFKDVKETQPLKIGIKQDLVKNLSARDDIVLGDKACMVSSLAYYVNSPSYHKNVIEGATRIGLEGEDTGIVTIDEAQYSLECRKAKLQKKKGSVKPDGIG